MDLLEKIRAAKEKLGQEQAVTIANGWSFDQFDERKMVASSPFSSDSTPSMHWDKDNLMWKDFSTGAQIGIIDYYMHKYDETYALAVKRLLKDAEIDDEFNIKHFDKDNDKYENYIFPKDASISTTEHTDAYLAKRSFTKTTIDFFHLKEDAHGNLVFNFYDLTGRLVGQKYRPTRPIQKGMPKYWWQKDCSSCYSLFNMQNIDITQPLVITEGMLDAMAVWQAGFHNVVSIPSGATDDNWVEWNYDFLSNFKSITLWFDPDKAGEEGLKKTMQRLGEYRCKIVEPVNEIADAVEEYYHQYTTESIRKTDANNVLIALDGSAVLSCINSAKDIDNPKIKKLFNYNPVQLQDLPSISFGCKGIDKILYGNFENSLLIVTGKPSGGKSTLLNQLYISQPLEERKKVFIFSGELTASMLVGNLLRPLASNRHIQEYDNGEDKPKGYSVNHDTISKLAEYYLDDVFIFDDGEDENELSTSGNNLLEQMEYAYRKHNCTVFILDNLLTLDLSNVQGDGKLEKQIEFVKLLKKFTRKYPVRVALVAHSRKAQAGMMGEQGLDDIEGSGAITKLADRCISVKRLNREEEEYDVEVKCLKDRQGNATNEKVKLYYDIPSMRFYSDEAELNRTYRWERTVGSHIRYTDDIKEKIVYNMYNGHSANHTNDSGEPSQPVM